MANYSLWVNSFCW